MKKKLYFALSSILFFCVTLFFLSIKPVNAIEIISPWSVEDNLLYPVASHINVGISEKLYVIGGANTDGLSDIIYSTQEPDGVVSEWVSDGFLPEERYFAASASNSTSIYLLGGATFNGFQSDVSTVYMAEVNSGGALENWQETTSLPNNLSLGAAVISGDRIFFAGGFNNSGVSDKVYSAPINSDGTLGVWVDAGNLPEARMGFGMIEHNGELIIIGGRDNSNNILDSVYKTEVNNDGTISAWTETSSFPSPIYRSSFIKTDSQILAIGGGNTFESTDKVYFVDLNSEGTLGEWTLSENRLPSPVNSGSAVKLGDYIYMTGGYNSLGEGYLDTVFSAKLVDSIDLNVPLLKQTDDPWGDDLYDSADLWAVGGQDMATWGCAVTSAAMVFDYYGLSNIDSSTDLNPGTLNGWLKSQEDGYVRNGSTNWLALSRLSNHISGLNGVDFNALEFSREISSDHQVVKDSIDNEVPSILRVPGHFIVGSGYTENNILINDPFHEREDLTEYGDTFENISRFTPSNTDLSYMMFVIDEDMGIVVNNEDGSEVGHMVLEEPIIDPSVSASSSSEPLKVVYVPKPESGEYEVNVSSNSSDDYILDAYLYDAEGDVKKISFEENIDGDDLHTYKINFDKDDNSDTEIIEHVTFGSLMDDLLNFYENGEMKNFGTYKSLNAQLQNAKRFYDANKVKLVFLNNFERKVKQYEKRSHLSTEAKDHLLERIKILIERL